MAEVIYKCGCMPQMATIIVADRRADQDVVSWVEDAVGKALAVDHRARSPQCRSGTTEYVKLPVHDDAPGIGMRRKR